MKKRNVMWAVMCMAVSGLFAQESADWNVLNKDFSSDYTGWMIAKGGNLVATQEDGYVSISKAADQKWAWFKPEAVFADLEAGEDYSIVARVRLGDTTTAPSNQISFRLSPENVRMPFYLAYGDGETGYISASQHGTNPFHLNTSEFHEYGIYVHAKQEGSSNVLRVVATDGHRLACVETPLPKGAEELKGVIIPRKTISEIRKLLDDNSVENVTVEISENKVRFSFADVILTSKLIDGTYPDYERVIPTDNDKNLELNVKELAAAVDRVSVVAERTRAIKMLTHPDKVTIITSSPDLGSASEDLEAKYDNEALEIGYNFRYLLDILAEIKGETVRLSFADGSSPSVIHDTSDASAIYVLMPMRV